MEDCYVIFAYDDYRKEVGQQILCVCRTLEEAKSLIAPLIHPACQQQHQYVMIEGDVFDQEIIPSDYESFHEALLEHYDTLGQKEEHDILLNLTEEEFERRCQEHKVTFKKIRQDLNIKQWYHRIGISKTKFRG